MKSGTGSSLKKPGAGVLKADTGFSSDTKHPGTAPAAFLHHSLSFYTWGSCIICVIQHYKSSSLVKQHPWNKVIWQYSPVRLLSAKWGGPELLKGLPIICSQRAIIGRHDNVSDTVLVHINTHRGHHHTLTMPTTTVITQTSHSIH